MLKEIMYERLRKIDDLEQRQLLKNIMSGVFANLIDYQTEWNNRLEERIFNEIDDFDNKYDVYVTLNSREDIDPIHDYLFPMLPSDLENKSIETKQILELIQNNETVKVSNVFLACDSTQIQKIIETPRIFKGKLFTSDGPLNIKVSLQKNTVYLQEVEKLYFTYQVNGIPWRTINHPYIHKFFDVILTECPVLSEDLEIYNVEIDLEEYEQIKYVNMVPLWNIERHEVKNSGFPIPAIDKVNYEHTISIRKLGTQHGYLIDSDEQSVRYIQHSEDELTIVSPLDKSGVWTLLKITQFDNGKLSKEAKYEVLSNQRIENFTNKYVRNYNANVKTKGEIIRLVNSFEVSHRLELIDIELKEVPPLDSVSYPVNAFLIEEMEEHHKKILLLSFKRKEEDTFISNDILSFLVSEVQRYFFEYKCVGKWL
jgi:hypothetical protein